MREDQGSSDGHWPEASAPGDPADPEQRQNDQDQTGQSGDSGAAATGPSSPGQSAGPVAYGWQALSHRPEWASPSGTPATGRSPGWPSPSGQYPSAASWPTPSSTPQNAPGDGGGAPGPDFSLPSYSPQPGPGSPQPGFGPPGGAGFGGYGTPGYGTSGYGGYLPQPGSGSRRRNLLTYLTVAVVAAAAGAGITGYLVNNSPSSRPAASGLPNGGLGNLGGSLPGGGAGSLPGGVSSATEQAVISKVRPGLVDISSNLGYQGGQAAATGMVISSNGLVLTNNHVITDTTGLSATVVTTGQHFAARWIGYDAKDDVAVIKLVGAHNLRTVPLGNSSAVKIGDRVIAMGNAEGAGGAPAVVGSITGMNQTITASDSGAGTSETLHNMLQTNAGIVQGDSGGALASTAGRVIGMNTAAATGNLGSTAQSIGYAIPINTAIRIARQIIAGKPGPNLQIGSTGFMGVLVPAGRASEVSSPAQQRKLQLKLDEAGSNFPVQPSSPVCLANDLNAGIPRAVAPVRSGALIIGDLCGTPASKAGIAPGDVITSVSGKPVTSPSDLTTVMTGLRPGMAVRVDWVAVNGQRHQATMMLAQAPPH
jgi:S1-C subfamily serine protease